jgi:hypothetical protein
VATILGLNLWELAFDRGLLVAGVPSMGACAGGGARGNPGARLFSFDIDLSHLLLRVPGAENVQSDWMAHPITGRDIFCYFDDHVDQCRRLREAAARGASLAVFDDDYDVTQFAPMGHGGLSLPKLSFCFDEALQDGEVIAWREGGRRHQWIVPKPKLQAARALVARYERLPDISAPFGVEQMPYSIVRIAAGG